MIWFQSLVTVRSQLVELEENDLPIAGIFMKNIRAMHPRRDQWGELCVYSWIPGGWPMNPMTVPDDRDFVSAPFSTGADQL